MMGHGIKELSTSAENAQLVALSVKDLKIYITQLENLDKNFIQESKLLGDSGFSGQFAEAFLEDVRSKESKYNALKEHTLDALDTFGGEYESFVNDMSSQPYMYDTELISVD